jgi:hypothetical protein
MKSISGVKWPEPEDDHSPPFISLVKIMWNRTSLPISFSGAVIGKNRNILP